MASGTNSIKTKLTRLSMLSSSSALLLACAGIILYEIVTFRSTIVRMAKTESQIIGANSVTALMFQDPKTAQATLAALMAEQNIISAGLYDRDGNLFANYRNGNRRNSSLPTVMPPQAADSFQFENKRLLLFHPIVFERELVGTVYIESDLSEMYQRLGQYGLMVGVVLVGSWLLALWISSRLRRPILGTVLSLANTAKLISRDKDFSVRAAAAGGGEELDSLTETFNEMLSQIQERDSALEQAHSELETRIAERTSELRQSEERFRLLVEKVSDYAIFMLDPSGHIVSWNRGAERITGYLTEEIVGKHFSVLYLPEDRAAGKAAIELHEAATEGRFEDQGWRMCKDGSRFWANVVLTTLCDADQNIVGFSKITRDLTAKKRAEDEIQKLNEELQGSNDELAATNKELEAFTYSVSHDLRAPLRHIDGFSKLLLDDYGKELPDEAREYISFIRGGTREMSQLVDDLLHLARIGRQELNVQLTGLNSIVDEIVSSLKKDTKGRAIEWQIE
jgi:PAS domain S-box-containing protein